MMISDKDNNPNCLSQFVTDLLASFSPEPQSITSSIYRLITLTTRNASSEICIDTIISTTRKEKQ